MKRYLVGGAVVIAAACAVLAVLAMRGPGPTDTAQAGREAPAVVENAPAKPAMPRLAAALPPLPSPDAPIEQAAPDLLARARAGDGLAACRLADIVLHCRDRLRRQEFESRTRHTMSGEPLDPEIAARNAEAAEKCRRLPEGVNAAQLLAQAARQGLPAAMLAYATGAHLSQEQGFAATPEFDAWLRDAPALLHAARDAGHREAVRHLAEAYLHDFGWPGALIPDDPVQANAHRRLGALLVEGGSPDSLPEAPPLDAGQRRAARELAARLHEKAFGGRRYPVPPRNPSTRHAPDTRKGLCD